jgi:hypothetical protein
MCAKCGIKKYDELPSRIGLKDIDAMRAALSKHLSVVEQLKRKLDDSVKLYNTKTKIKPISCKKGMIV